ncbi:MAG: hypothetical protein C4325_08115 [Blastocatellia bacterium]
MPKAQKPSEAIEIAMNDLRAASTEDPSDDEPGGGKDHKDQVVDYCRPETKKKWCPQGYRVKAWQYFGSLRPALMRYIGY